MLKQFDIVRIISTKSIRFLSGPPGRAAVPDGDWSVVGIVGYDIIIAKDETIVRAPLSAIKLIASYDPQDYINQKLKEHKDGGKKG